MELNDIKGELSIADVLGFLIQSGPGRTERELSQAIFADRGYQQRVNQDCAILVSKGRVKRSGNGGVADPFTYWPVTS